MESPPAPPADAPPEHPLARARLRPWMVVATLALAGLLGAVSVNVLARAQHRRDARDITRWQATVLPIVDDAQRGYRGVAAVAASVFDAETPPRTAAASLTSLRGDIELARRRLLASRAPRVTFTALTHFANGVSQTLQALTATQKAVGERATGAELAALGDVVDGFLARAAREFTAGRAVLDDLVCRARLPACARLRR